jgi:hypothetical protein
MKAARWITLDLKSLTPFDEASRNLAAESSQTGENPVINTPPVGDNVADKDHPRGAPPADGGVS